MTDWEYLRLARLGTGRYWRRAVETQWIRVLDAAAAWRNDDVKSVDDPNFMGAYETLHFEAVFLLTAINNVRVYAVAIVKRTADQRVQQAIEDFDAAAPRVKELRDFITHLDEYLVGGGRYRGTLTFVPDGGPMVLSRPSECEVTLMYGDVKLSLGAASRAATTLADAMFPVVWEHVLRLQAERLDDDEPPVI
jgi:hypothetical protein